MPNIYEVNVKVDEKYDCREKVPNIYEVNVKAREKVLFKPAEYINTGKTLTITRFTKKTFTITFTKHGLR